MRRIDRPPYSSIAFYNKGLGLKICFSFAGLLMVYPYCQKGISHRAIRLYTIGIIPATGGFNKISVAGMLIMQQLEV